MKRLIALALIAVMHATVAAQIAECTWIDNRDAGLLLIGTFTDTSVRFVLRNNSSQAHRVTTDAFAQLHDCYLSPGHRCAIRVGDRNYEPMGFNFKTVWPGDYIESAVAIPRRDDPEGNPAKYYRVRLQVRDVPADIGTHPDSVTWGLCRAETPVPALPLPFIIIGAAVLFLLRYRAC